MARFFKPIVSVSLLPLRPLLITGLVLMSVACSGPHSQSSGPSLTIADASVLEGDAGTSNLVFTVSLASAAATDITVNYATNDGTATAGSDYTATNGTLTLAAGSTTATINVPILGDTVFESDETFTLTLSSPSANVTLGTASATGTIINDDSAFAPIKLNDTGVRFGGNYPGGNNADCSAGETVAQQDCAIGRDALALAGTLTKVGGGVAGFDFTKLDSHGQPLANQAASYGATPWQCVRDNHTGLVWEVKTDDNGLHDKDWEYSWYNSDASTNGGHPGLAQALFRSPLECGGSLTNCNTEELVAAVNAAGWCGANDWRLPTLVELRGLVDFNIDWASRPSIDTAYFPNLPGDLRIWSGVNANYNLNARWGVDFGGGGSFSNPDQDFPVFLVRTGH